MKTIVLGKNIERKWKLVSQKNDEGKYFSKPFIKYEADVSHDEILNFDGEINYNSSYNFDKSFNISEDEEVILEKSIFRADIPATLIYTNKVLSKKDINKEQAETLLINELKLYNKQLIEADDRLSTYCKIHNLDPLNCVYDELVKVIGCDNKIFEPNLKSVSSLIDEIAFTSSNRLLHMQRECFNKPYGLK